MKPRAPTLLVSIGGLVLAGFFLTFGIIITSSANTAARYVADQLSQQDITFRSVGSLTVAEKQAPCLVRYAGQKLTTGAQAQCYANEYISQRLKSVAGGRSYAQLATPHAQLRDQLAQAQKSNSPQAADLQKQLNDMTNQRETLFKAETLRGSLLTTYAFSQSGAKAAQQGTAAFAACALMALLSIGGLVYAFAPSRSEPAVVTKPASEAAALR
jgi:hypothetical protein